MKRMDFLCTSPSSTAICSSLDRRSMVRHSTTTTTSSKQPIFGTCSSRDFFPVNPNKQRRSTSVALSDLYKNPSSVSDKQKQSTTFDFRRRSSADVGDLLLQLRRRQQRHIRLGSSNNLLTSDGRMEAPNVDRVSNSALVPNSDRSQLWPNRRKENSSIDVLGPDRGHHHSPPSALARSYDRVLDSGHISGMVVATTSYSKPNRSQSGDGMTSDKHVVSTVVPTQTSTPRRVSFQDCPPVLKSSSSARSHDQVVVLRVSIHCKGCEGKVRKHISKMEGVTSFSIDLATKQVIVKGKVTPLGVLASISKVKTAQLWAPSSSLLHPTSSPPPAAAPRWST